MSTHTCAPHNLALRGLELAGPGVINENDQLRVSLRASAIAIAERSSISFDQLDERLSAIERKVFGTG